MFVSHESAHYYTLKQNTQMLLQAVVRLSLKFPKSLLVVDVALLSASFFFRTAHILVSLISRWMMMFTIKRLCNGDIIFGNYCELCNNSIIWLPSSVIATENDRLCLLFGWCLTGTPTLTYFKKVFLTDELFI